MKFLYRCFTAFYVVPVTLFILTKWLLGDREQVERLGWGLKTLPGQKQCYWFIASSVGETNIALRLIRRVKETSDASAVLTVTTAAGKSRAIQSGCGCDRICYHPLDCRRFVGRFFRTLRPQKIFLIETELWPILMEQAIVHGVKLYQVSGRISANSFRRYFPLKPLFKPLLMNCELLMMQSVENSERITKLGGMPSKVMILSSLKNVYVPPDVGRLAAVRRLLAPWNDMLILACGSTRPGEEEIILDAFQPLRRKYAGLRIILAPRHLERKSEVAALVKERSLAFAFRSNSSLRAEHLILFLDTIGELDLFYHCSDLAFVGGTLAPLGGHNVLEPALAGCPVIVGPHCFNQRDAVETLKQHRLIVTVCDQSQLVQAVDELLQSTDRKSELAVRVQQLRAENAELLERYLRLMMAP